MEYGLLDTLLGTQGEQNQTTKIEYANIRSIINQDSIDQNKPENTNNKEYIVNYGDTLTKIAENNNTTVERLFYKNTNIENPDTIDVGIKILIPNENEELVKRDIPQQIIVNNNLNYTTALPRSTPTYGNTYSYGYCTWYAKQRRPDLPNNLGNAITWASRAAAQGIPTGSTPRAGAIGQQGNHVVYVERVNGDGTITISEMNYKGWNIKSTRTASASSFRYIY